MKYLKVWTDFETVLSPLNDDEIGRLFLAMLRYARSGETPSGFTGNESFLWAVAKRDIDMMSEKDEILRQNGAKGGRPKTKDNQTKPNLTKDNQTEPNAMLGYDTKPNKSLKEIERKEIERNRTEGKETALSDDDSAVILRDHDEVISAAENAGFPRNDATRAKLVDLYSQYGLEKMLVGIGECVNYGVSTIAYLSAVLAGKPKKAAPANTNPATDYHQRDYYGEQDDAFDLMMRRLNAIEVGMT